MRLERWIMGVLWRTQYVRLRTLDNLKAAENE